MYVAMQSVMLRRPSLLPLLPALPAPTLFIAAARDAYNSQQETCQAAGLLPHGACTVLAGNGHVAPLLGGGQRRRAGRGHAGCEARSVLPSDRHVHTEWSWDAPEVLWRALAPAP
jgi:hypothetical protein